MKDRRLLARVVFLLYMAAVLYLCFGKFSSLSSVPRQLLGIDSDKLVHFLMFLPFPILFYLSFGCNASKPLHSILLALGTLCLGSLIAAGTELVQDFIPYRASDPADFLADFLALALSSFIILLIDLNKKKRNA